MNKVSGSLIWRGCKTESIIVELAALASVTPPFKAACLLAAYQREGAEDPCSQHLHLLKPGRWTTGTVGRICPFVSGSCETSFQLPWGHG